MASKKKMTLKMFKERLLRLMLRKRSGIKPTTVIRDKTKYSRKKKHKDTDE